MERNQRRLENLKGIEDNPLPKLITAYEKLKEDKRNPTPKHNLQIFYTFTQNLILSYNFD
jgi:hypothetical protein